MDVASSWDFTLANYDAVWAFLVQLGLLLLFLMLGNILRRTIPFFRKCLVPSALLGGGLLLAVDVIAKQLGFLLAMLRDKGQKETFRYIKKSVLRGKPVPWEE